MLSNEASLREWEVWEIDPGASVYADRATKGCLPLRGIVHNFGGGGQRNTTTQQLFSIGEEGRSCRVEWRGRLQLPWETKYLPKPLLRLGAEGALSSRGRKGEEMERYAETLLILIAFTNLKMTRPLGI